MLASSAFATLVVGIAFWSGLKMERLISLTLVSGATSAIDSLSEEIKDELRGHVLSIIWKLFLGKMMRKSL